MPFWSPRILYHFCYGLSSEAPRTIFMARGMVSSLIRPGLARKPVSSSLGVVGMDACQSVVAAPGSALLWRYNFCSCVAFSGKWLGIGDRRSVINGVVERIPFVLGCTEFARARRATGAAQWATRLIPTSWQGWVPLGREERDERRVRQAMNQEERHWRDGQGLASNATQDAGRRVPKAWKDMVFSASWTRSAKHRSRSGTAECKICTKMPGASA